MEIINNQETGLSGILLAVFIIIVFAYIIYKITNKN